MTEPGTELITTKAINICKANLTKRMDEFLKKGYVCSFQSEKDMTGDNESIAEDLTLVSIRSEYLEIGYSCRQQKHDARKILTENDQVMVFLEIHPSFCTSRFLKDGELFTNWEISFPSDHQITKSGIEETCKTDFMEELKEIFMKEDEYACSLYYDKTEKTDYKLIFLPGPDSRKPPENP